MGGKARVELSNSVHLTLEDLAPVLDRHRGRSIVIGGIAVIARGVPRVTRDVDVAFSGAEVTLSGLLTDLDAAGIVPRIDDAIEFAAESQVLLSRHAKTGVDIDVSFAWLPFEMEAIAAASPAMLGAAQLRDLAVTELAPTMSPTKRHVSSDGHRIAIARSALSNRCDGTLRAPTCCHEETHEAQAPLRNDPPALSSRAPPRRGRTGAPGRPV